MNKIIEIKFGSALYGTSTPKSDIDLKALYIPSPKEIVLGNYKEVINLSRKKKECERNTKEDIDIEIFSLDRFVKELMVGQTWALDFLFATPDSVVEVTEQGKQILDHLLKNKDRLLTKNINAFASYARRQAHKYGIKGTRMDALKRTMALLETLPPYDRLSGHSEALYALVKETESIVSLENSPLIEIVMIPGPNRIDLMPHLHVCGRKMPFQSTVKVAKECYGRILDEYGSRAQMAHLTGGHDYKALSHSVRVNSEALELLSTGHITFPRPDKDLLLKIKTNAETGAMKNEEICSLIEEGMVLLTEAQKLSTLRSDPDKEWADNFIFQVYSDIVKNS